MATDPTTIEARICALAENATGAPPGSVQPVSEWDDILGSLDETDFILRVEADFGITLGLGQDDPLHTAMIARRPFRMSDLADLIVRQRGTGWALHSRCPQCRYPLIGLGAGVCPECGSPIGRSVT